MGIFKRLSNHKGLVRGVVSYSIIWPLSSITQEYVESRKPLSQADWVRAARFGAFGSLCMAPMVYVWQKCSNPFFVKKTLSTAVTRAIIEQIVFTPFALATFFFCMSILELKSIQASKTEVEVKLWPTYKKAIVFWPAVQSINFYLVPERNRIVYVSVASFIWTMIIASMKADGKKEVYQIDNKKV